MSAKREAWVIPGDGTMHDDKYFYSPPSHHWVQERVRRVYIIDADDYDKREARCCGSCRHRVKYMLGKPECEENVMVDWDREHDPGLPENFACNRWEEKCKKE
jgi:hypothetical protein